MQLFKVWKESIKICSKCRKYSKRVLPNTACFRCLGVLVQTSLVLCRHRESECGQAVGVACRFVFQHLKWYCFANGKKMKRTWNKFQTIWITRFFSFKKASHCCYFLFCKEICDHCEHDPFFLKIQSTFWVSKLIRLVQKQKWNELKTISISRFFFRLIVLLIVANHFHPIIQTLH